MHCSKCGYIVDLIDNYCKNCGRELNKSSKLKTISIIFGIIGLTICFYLSPISFILGIIGLIFSLISNKNLKNIYGIILNSFLILISIFILLFQMWLITKLHFGFNFDKGYLKRVGNDYVGYIEVPIYFNKASTKLENKIEYKNSDGWNISLYVIEDAYITVKNYVFDIEKKYSNNKYEYIRTEEYFKEETYIVKVIGYNEKSELWIYNWIFKEKNGDLHHIRIEGPDLSSNNFNLIETYNLKG